MREEVERPEHLIDINALPLRDIRMDGTTLVIGALARMSDVAAHPDVMRSYPLIVEALLEGARHSCGTWLLSAAIYSSVCAALTSGCSMPPARSVLRGWLRRDRRNKCGPCHFRHQRLLRRHPSV